MNRHRPRSTALLARAATLFAVLALAALALTFALAPAGTAARQAGTAGVVNIVTVLGYQNGAAAGTGIVLNSSGLILTNNHVIRDATTIRVSEPGSGRTYSATVIGYDLGADIALLQLKNASGLHPATLGDSSRVSVGDHVTALGNAGGAGGAPAVSTGRVTGLNRHIVASDPTGDSEQLTGLIQIDAPLQPGDSGGPLLNARGEVVGVDTAASTGFFFNGGGSDSAFAVPINRALTIVKQLQSGKPSPTGHVGPTPFLGVSLDRGGDFGAPTSGAVVTGVVPGSPAERVGLEAGDVITAVDGKSVSSPDRVTTLLLHMNPGKTIRLSWLDEFGTRHGGTAKLVAGPPH